MLEALSNEKIFMLLYMSLLIRYTLISGALYYLLYKLFRTKYIQLKIQKKFPKSKDYKREIKYSFISLTIFSTMMLIPFNSQMRPYTMLYEKVSDFGILYFVFSCVLLLLLHDAYFYWTHRLLHTKQFSKFHVVHHESTNPTPFSAFSFHPIEAIVQVGFFCIIPFVLPLHLYAIAFLGLYMFFYNGYGHSGYEFFKDKHFFFNTSTLHNKHHKYYHGNYGLYFSFWDKLMKTLRN